MYYARSNNTRGNSDVERNMFPSRTELLTSGEARRVHEASLEILEHVGLEVNNARAREIFRWHGCRIDQENLRVTIPSPVVEEFRQAIPAKFTFRARNPDFDRTIPDDAPLTMTASFAPNLIDPVTNERRRATSEDIARIARLVNKLPGVDLFSVRIGR
jgi:trimethylamine--corrinoid protein Co-methyltransferase